MKASENIKALRMEYSAKRDAMKMAVYAAEDAEEKAAREFEALPDEISAEEWERSWRKLDKAMDKRQAAGKRLEALDEALEMLEKLEDNFKTLEAEDE